MLSTDGTACLLPAAVGRARQPLLAADKNTAAVLQPIAELQLATAAESAHLCHPR